MPAVRGEQLQLQHWGSTSLAAPRQPVSVTLSLSILVQQLHDLHHRGSSCTACSRQQPVNLCHRIYVVRATMKETLVIHFSPFVWVNVSSLPEFVENRQNLFTSLYSQVSLTGDAQIFAYTTKHMWGMRINISSPSMKVSLKTQRID